ncbi:MAG: DUF1501 domain-containing protein [Pirellulaceae bacterium]
MGSEACGCGSEAHFPRRTWMKGMAAFGAASWLTPLATVLARQAETSAAREPARSVIVLWLQGGPSQLETFDPHPNTNIAGGSLAIETRVPGVMLGNGLPRVADVMDSISLVRSVTSREGDHERAVYNIKTGFRPDPTLIHPSIGAIVCRQTEEADQGLVDIPRHVSILSDQFPSRGGYMGNRFDPFKTGDPNQPIPDLVRPVDDVRYRKRLSDLTNVVDREFARGRIQSPGVGASVARDLTEAALKMMDSDQLAAFDVSNATQAQRDAFGDTPFGRGCLAAVRLIETGVRCVEVTLGGWDSHIDNHEIHAGRNEILDPSCAALDPRAAREHVARSPSSCAPGEFGRTPHDQCHEWARTIGPTASVSHSRAEESKEAASSATASQPKLDPDHPELSIDRPVAVQDIHATVLTALGIDPRCRSSSRRSAVR